MVGTYGIINQHTGSLIYETDCINDASNFLASVVDCTLIVLAL